MILQVIDVLIGLSAVYLIFSTIASALFELVESVLKRRGALLERGIGEIFARIVTGDGTAATGDAAGLLAAFYQSPHIYSLFQDAYRPGGRNLPSYIPAERFAGAVMALARNGALKLDFERIRNTILTVGGADLATVEQTAEQQVVEMRTRLMAYFDASMERVSGWYGRHARAWLLGIGLAIAGLFNVDTLQLMQQLSQDDGLRQSVVSRAIGNRSGLDAPPSAQDNDTAPDPGSPDARAQIEQQLRLIDTLGLPVGWKADDWREATERRSAVLSKLFGMLLTALALSFGAPFWFDLLNQLASLRTSVKPGDPARPDKSPDESAEASLKS